MTKPFAPRLASRSRLGAAAVLSALSLCAVALSGCKTLDEPGKYAVGATLIDPEQRNPILVSQQPAGISVGVPAGARGLNSSQRAQVTAFLQHFRATDPGNSKLVILVPAGTPNETSSMRAVGEMNGLIKEVGFADNVVQVQPYYGGRDGNAPIRLSYMRYVAQPPLCGLWPTNLARDERNLNYQNFGCAQQANLAAMIANPADLVQPRTMDPADQERRAVVFDRYRQGRATASERSADENANVKVSN